MKSNLSHFGTEAVHPQPERPDLAPSYIDNMIRLGLLHRPDGRVSASQHDYKELEEWFEIEEIREKWREKGLRLQVQRGIVTLKELRKEFCRICVVEEESIGLKDWLNPEVDQVRFFL